MNLNALETEKIALLGLGSEHYAMLEYLKRRKLRCKATVFDKRPFSQLVKQYPAIAGWKDISWTGAEPQYKNLKTYSLIFRSPGVFMPPVLRQQLKKNGALLTCPMDLFMRLSPSQHIIGVTGTKGKGTTSSLICAILKQARKRVWLGGNIGVAPFSFISKIKAGDWIVLELSSFQLEDMSCSPHIGVLTNLSPEHLAPADPNNPNYHVSLKNYYAAKFNIFKFQDSSDFAIINKNIKAPKCKSKVLRFGSSSLATPLPGKHNLENIAAAETVAQVIGIKQSVIKQAVQNFKGLEHRLEKVASKKGLTFYNDSFATTPMATITALKAFTQPIILLAGGADKGADFSQLARVIKQQSKAVILLRGVATPRLKRDLLKARYNAKTIFEASSMAMAMKTAKKIAATGDIILLSPACASFGMFKNYKDRGEQFKRQALLR